MWCHHGEKLAHNLCHAIEMARTHGAFHYLSYRTEVKLTCVRLGIYLLDGGDECVVHARLLKLEAVRLLCARICA